MLTKLYRKIVSKALRERIYKLFLGDFLLEYRDKKEEVKWLFLKCYFKIVKPKNETEQAYMDWANSIRSSYPYLWTKEYRDNNYLEEIDQKIGLPYVNHNGKKLYYKRDSMGNLPSSYKALLIEQDPRSAHRYVTSYNELKGKTLLDIGAAEAIFTLDTIELIKHAYLFECDEAWIEALNATFAPWKEKITIVRKYVSDVDDANNITIDTFLKNKPAENIFLKMDIEGYEGKALRGAEQTIHKTTTSGSVCIYHRKEDAVSIPALLKYYSKQTEIQSGYLYMGREMRKAIVRFN